MMIPEAWENHHEMDRSAAAFYEFHSALMEPWDGPACVVFTDGTQIGAVLDRNGLRPSRYWVTDDGLVVLASEVGVLDLDPATIVRKGRLQPGRMFLVDTDEHRIIEDDEIKAALAAEHPYDEWLHAGLIHLDDIPEREHIVHTHASVDPSPAGLRLHRGGAAGPADPDGEHRRRADRLDGHRHARSRRSATRRACCSTTSPSCSPRSPTRRSTRSARSCVTSLSGTIGPEANLLEPTPASCRQIVLPFPVFDNDDLAKIRHINRDGDMPGFIDPRRPRPVRRRGRRRGDGRASRRDLRRGQPRRSRTAPASSCSPTGTRTPELAPIPSLLLHRRGPPPPGPGEDPHPGRPDRRGRRRPRGPPRRPADRLRRGRGQPLPRHGVGRGPRPRRALRAGPSPRWRSTTSSRHSARACSR